MNIKKMTLFGATGLLGSDLVKRAPAHWKVMGHNHETDLAHRDLILSTVRSERPDCIVNAAALSNVDLCEREPERAYAVNAHGAENLAEAARELNIPVVYVSTDYVYPGHPTKLFTEDDETGALQLYGKSKEEGERLTRAWEKHYVLRVSALYGTARAAHPQWVISAITSKVPAKIATDMVGSPGYTKDLADGIFRMLDKNAPFGTYNLGPKGVCSRWEFATEICRLLSVPKPYPLEAVTTADLKLKAARPTRPAMSIAKWENNVGRAPSWQESLFNFLKDTGHLK